MNGFVSGPVVVTAYVEKINELFERPEYLEKQRAALLKSPGLAYTEMNAYVTFREETALKTIHLATAIDTEAFDDALCFYLRLRAAPTKNQGAPRHQKPLSRCHLQGFRQENALWRDGA